MKREIHMLVLILQLSHFCDVGEASIWPKTLNPLKSIDPRREFNNLVVLVLVCPHFLDTFHRLIRKGLPAQGFPKNPTP